MNNFYRRLCTASPMKIRRYALFNVVFLPILPILGLVLGFPFVVVCSICRHTKEFFLDVVEAIGDYVDDIAFLCKRPKNKIKDYLENCQMLITGRLPDRIIKEFEEENI